MVMLVLVIVVAGNIMLAQHEPTTKALGLFTMHSEGLVTTLVAKDRVLAHNPIGALALADTYDDRVWGPQRPEHPPKLPREGRRK